MRVKIGDGAKDDTGDIAAAFNVPGSRQRLNDLGLDLVASPPAELTAYAQKESRHFGKPMAKAGIEKA